MNSGQRRVFTLFKGVFFLHFALLFAYCFPDQFVPGFLDDLSKRYAYPLFQARWNLFAPDPPKMHKEIRFRYFRQDRWSDWQDPVTEIEEAHHKSRIAAPTKMYHVIQNGSHYLWDDYYKHEGESIRESFGYQTMHYFIQKMYPEIQMDSLQLKLILEGPPEFTSSTNRVSKELHFPAAQILHE